MIEKQKETEKQRMEEIKALQDNQTEEREKLLAEQEKQKLEFLTLMDKMKRDQEEREIEHAKKQRELLKLVEKKNYEAHYPIPEGLKEHKQQNRKSFNIQVLGCRGAGKSTLINDIMRSLKLPGRVETDLVECTKDTAYLEITDAIINKPEKYGKVFICDQPGIGGLEITEAGYLQDFGPGSFINTLKSTSLF